MNPIVVIMYVLLLFLSSLSRAKRGIGQMFSLAAQPRWVNFIHLVLLLICPDMCNAYLVLTARPPTLPPPAQITTNVTLSILGSMKPNVSACLPVSFLPKCFASTSFSSTKLFSASKQLTFLSSTLEGTLEFFQTSRTNRHFPIPQVPNVSAYVNVTAVSEHQFIYDGLEIGTNVVKLGHNEVVQMVINNQGPMAHPVHLHGHRFYSLGIGPENITEYVYPPTTPPKTTVCYLLT